VTCLGSEGGLGKFKQYVTSVSRCIELYVRVRVRVTQLYPPARAVEL